MSEQHTHQTDLLQIGYILIADQVLIGTHKYFYTFLRNQCVSKTKA